MEKPNSFINTLLHRWKLLSFVGIALLIFFVLSQYSFISVTVSGTNAAAAELELSKVGAKAKKLHQGLNVVLKGDYTLRASTDDELTEKHTKLKPFTMNHEEIELVAQRAIQKVASDSLGCVVAKGDLGSARETFTYNCESANSVTRYSFINKPVSSLALSRTVYSATSYGGGLLGFVGGVPGADEVLSLAYVQGESIKPMNYIANPLLDISKYQILVPKDSRGQDKQALVVADGNEGKLTLFKNISDKTPKTLSFKIAPGSFYSFTINDDTVYVLASSVNSSNGQTDDAHSFSGGTLTRYSIKNGEFNELGVVKVPESFDLSGLKALGRDVFAVADLGGTIDIYSINGKEIVAPDHIEQADDMVVFRDGIVYRHNNEYLKYDVGSKQSQLVYRLDKLTPTYLQNTNGQLVFSALVPNTKEQYSFVMVDKERSDGLERILNYPRENISVRSIDYNDSTIYAEFALTSFTSDHATGRFTYDPSEVTEKKSELMQKLQTDGVDTSKYKIISQ